MPQGKIPTDIRKALDAQEAKFKARKTGPNGLTEKQQRFVYAYLENGHNGCAAYRSVYSATASDGTAGKSSYNLLRDPKVVQELERLTNRQREAEAAAIAARRITKDWLTEGLATLFDDAVKQRDRSGAAQVGRLLAEIGGWRVERRETRRVRSFEDLQQDELIALAGDDPDEGDASDE